MAQRGSIVIAGMLVVWTGAFGCQGHATRFGPDDPPLTCDDDIIQAPEVCDGRALDDHGCTDQPVPEHPSQRFYRGQLRCKANCLAFDTSNCSGFCGDGFMDDDAPTGPELCDTNSLSGKKCTDFVSPVSTPFYEGTLACSKTCDAYDTSACVGYCGDRRKQAQFGESCDALDFGGDSCESRGFYRGALKCSGDCLRIDASACNGRCGDGVVDVANGEQCDGAAFAPGLTCQDGVLQCAPDCRVDRTRCHDSCGNSICEPRFGENCANCPEDCGCGTFGDCTPEGVCKCVVDPYMFVDCNNRCAATEKVNVGCLSCGGPGCHQLSPPSFGVTWLQLPVQPGTFSVCSNGNANNCLALQGDFYDFGGCEPFFWTDHMDGCASPLEECVQTLITQLNAQGLWPQNRSHFHAADIHMVSINQFECR